MNRILTMTLGCLIIMSVSAPVFSEDESRNECRQYLPLESVAGRGVPMADDDPMYYYTECLKKHQREENRQTDKTIEDNSQ